MDGPGLGVIGIELVMLAGPRGVGIINNDGNGA